jgi:hypothetical protein
MKKLVLVLTICGFCVVYAENRRNSECSLRETPESTSGRGIIAMVGSVTSIYGAPGKNICVDANGADIAVMYGSLSDPWDPNFPFGGVAAAYSTDQGETWNHYGPISTTSPLRFIYPGIDGAPNFSQNLEEIFSVWQEDFGGMYVMNWGTYVSTQLSENCWKPCVGVNPDDPLHVIVSGWHFFNGRNYAWISTDGGYMWSDSISMTDSGTAGHFRWGSDDYAFFTYQDDYSGDEYPYYVESTDGGFTWSNPATLPAITSENFLWNEFDCEVINNKPFAVHNDLDYAGVMQLFYPDPDTPGSPGAWNWTVLDVDAVGSGAFAYQGTTWTTSIIQYPSIAYDSNYEIILITYKASYEVTPPPAGWTDGNYLGGIVSIDHGRTWYPTRPLSGPLLQAVGGPIETAHRLVTIDDTTYCYSTWTDADDGTIGFQYFELGAVLPIDLDGWNVGVAENNRGISSTPGVNLAVFPSVVNHSCCISFSISQPGHSSIKLFDASGRLTKVVYNGYLQSGYHNYDITTSDLPNGMYMVVLKSNSDQDVAKLIKMR